MSEENAKPAMTPQQAKLTGRAGSPFATYRELAVGQASLGYLAYYELAMLFASGLPGLLGFGSRALLFPPLFKSCGGKLACGRGVQIRRAKQISIGRGLLLDDYAVLDVRGDDAGITLGDYVSLGRFTTLAAKGGHISLGNGVNIGSYCRVATQSRVEIGDSTLIAAYVYLGPGNHQRGDNETPLIAREMEIKGGVKIGKNVWIGARATILDGVTIGDGAVIGAHSLVKDNVPAGAVAVGTPAKIVTSV